MCVSLFVSMRVGSQCNLMGITRNPPSVGTQAEAWTFCAKVTYWRGRPFWMPVKKVQRRSAVAFCPCQRITHCSHWAEQPSMSRRGAKWKISGYRHEGYFRQQWFLYKISYDYNACIKQE